METKTHWKKLINKDYLGVYSLENGADMVVTIEKIERQMVKGEGGKSEECTVAILKGCKPMILNADKQKTIQKIYGTPYIEEWKGKSITLYCSTTKFKGEDVECLKIRQSIPVIGLPELNPFLKVKWENAVKALKGGKTIEDIEKFYTISEENKTKLKNESI